MLDKTKVEKIARELSRTGDYAKMAAQSVPAMYENGTLRSGIVGMQTHFQSVLDEIDATDGPVDTGDGGDGGNSGGPKPRPPVIFPVWPGRPVIDESTVPELITDLHGLPLPERPHVDYSLPRSGTYGVTLDNRVQDLHDELISHWKSSGAILRGQSALLRAKIGAIEKDGIKGDGGSEPGNWLILGCHVFGIPLVPGAHGDAFQNEGGFIRLHIGDTFLDVPCGITLIPGAEWSNACMQMDNKQGDAGLVTIERVIFRGGNYCINVADKGTGKTLPTFKQKAAAYIVEPGSPQYGLFDSMPAGRYEFDDDCNVYELVNGICRHVTNDVQQYNEDMTKK
ncbi:MAG: hypothetical protein H6829_09570 [Planctomycetes bacterium]|nr:hypothetical protein [Planctomycetota bacterium]MCB9912625.1 hypothetical protein [Planctomycetota bacterium]HRV80247.1 hypothetical protein [Planctomycetota bacterium]